MRNYTMWVPLVSVGLLCVGVLSAGSASGSPTHRTEHFFAVDVEGDDLLLVDKVTASTKQVATVIPPSIGGLAYDHDAVLIYAIDTQSRCLWTIDPAQGWAMDAVGCTEVVEPQAAAIDPSSGHLFVLGTDDDHAPASILYLVDKATASAAALGLTGFDYLSALDFDPLSGMLYAARSGVQDTGVLVTLNPMSGNATEVASTRKFVTISFDETGTLYGVDNSGYFCGLYIIDKTTGTTSLVDYLWFVDNIRAAVFDSTIPTPVEGESWGRIKALFAVTGGRD